ncbi:hypothetical protein HRG_009615 [Hirsutella rhossiliensis]|uniref:Uncharacterized protein n=1 Tax=Hirsutella rhossiliensis TaxID=111463 RepID=A0A9P8MQ74_9HYPO|nr:uncharacterized protein HRG_09615 [Hirsutella rhossiliensis]KAH0959154.1 hypothetical protein HRG_09615 [Hirsutella rhossiliensis]
MDPPPFTADEKRFVLAEIVKSSAVDIDTLIIFIQTNNISPDWMQMQLPHGRNMSQCMQVFKQLSIHPGAWSGQSTSGQGEPASSHTGGATTTPERDAPYMPAVTKNRLLMPKQFAPIAPRPVDAKLESQDRGQPVSSLPGSQKPSRKRGRPSKADMAKRDLKPILPKPIAPRPPPQKGAYGTGPGAPSHPRETTQTASPETTPATLRPTSTEDTEDTKRRRLTTPAS